MTTSSSTISAKFGCMMLRILIAASIMATASCGLESTSFTGVQQVPEILTVTGETMGTTFKVLMVRLYYLTSAQTETLLVVLLNLT